MQGPTTDGTALSNTVTGVLAYNQLKPVTETGLPTSKSTIIDSGSSVPITVKVKNTTNHTGFFELQPTNNDISGIALSTVEINKWLPKKYYVIAGKILMFFTVSGKRKLCIRLSLFHVCLFSPITCSKS